MVLLLLLLLLLWLGFRFRVSKRVQRGIRSQGLGIVVFGGAQSRVWLGVFRTGNSRAQLG